MKQSVPGFVIPLKDLLLPGDPTGNVIFNGVETDTVALTGRSVSGSTAAMPASAL